MKIDWKKIVVLSLVVVGGVGVCVATISSVKNNKPSSAASMSDASMASMQNDTTKCEMCLNGKPSQCLTGNCPHNDSMMNMTMGSTMAANGNMKDKMGAEKMTESNMGNKMSQSMKDKSMTPDLGSAKMVDKEQMVVAPKM